MRDEVWRDLLVFARDAHQSHAKLSAFCEFPDDIRFQNVTPFQVSAADLFGRELALATSDYTEFRDAVVAAGPHAHWRETYKGTDIGEDFMSRFGCYCLIGDQGPFTSQKMRAWIVYMPPKLHYRWHQHSGEEMYLVIAGKAEFLRDGVDPVTLRSGQTSTHASDQPHAMETYDSAVLAYVIWRNGFDGAPGLTPSEATP